MLYLVFFFCLLIFCFRGIIKGSPLYCYSHLRFPRITHHSLRITDYSHSHFHFHSHYLIFFRRLFWYNTVQMQRLKFLDKWSQSLSFKSRHDFLDRFLRDCPVEVFLPSSVTLEGNIEATGLIRVEGILKGKVKCPVIVIAQNAQATVEVEAQCVYVEGSLRGIVSSYLFYLSSSGKAEGEIKTEVLFVDQGAWMKGKLLIEKGRNHSDGENR